MPRLLAARPSRERSIVLALIAQRLLRPGSKLAATRSWHASTLAEELGVQDATVNEVYAALDWVRAHQAGIERKLVQRHLQPTRPALYDSSSSSYHGRTCLLVCCGYNRDGPALPCVMYGLLTDPDGRPVALRGYPGNTADTTTVTPSIARSMLARSRTSPIAIWVPGGR